MLLNEKTITLQIKVSNRTYNTDTIVDIKRLDMLKKEEKNSIYRDLSRAKRYRAVR